MKVNDVITHIDGEILIKQMLDKYKTWPQGSISPREVVKGMNFPVQSREEAEELMAQLNATVSSAILDFQVNAKKSK